MKTWHDQVQIITAKPTCLPVHSSSRCLPTDEHASLPVGLLASMCLLIDEHASLPVGLLASRCLLIDEHASLPVGLLASRCLPIDEHANLLICWSFCPPACLSACSPFPSYSRLSHPPILHTRPSTSQFSCPRLAHPQAGLSAYIGGKSKKCMPLVGKESGEGIWYHLQKNVGKPIC